jgi:hypothetical protein
MSEWEDNIKRICNTTEESGGGGCEEHGIGLLSSIKEGEIFD